MAQSRQSPATTRLVVRHIAELTITRMHRWWLITPQDRLDGLVVGIVLSASIAHHAYRNPKTGQWVGIDDADLLGRPVNGTAIARSMGLAHTTVRRRATALVDTGLLVSDTSGFKVAPKFFSGDGLSLAMAGDVADLMRILPVLADAHYPPANAALAADLEVVPKGVVARLLLTFVLRTLETLIAMNGDIISGAILGTIVALNVRHITECPALAHRYAHEDSPPPDSVRRPITVRALAKALDMPFETVRRHVAVLVEKGEIVRQADGVIVPVVVLSSDRIIDNNRRVAAFFEQMLNTLIGLAEVAREICTAGISGMPI